MEQSFTFLSMPILRTVATGQLRTLLIFIKNNAILKFIVWFGVVSFGLISPYIFKNESGRAVRVNSARCIEIISNFLEEPMQASC
jgi:hypothetical protein